MIPHNSSTRRSTSLSSANSNNPPTFPSLNKEITRSISTSIANVIERNVNGSSPEKKTSLLTSFKQLHEPTIKNTKKFSIENTKRGQSEDRQLFHYYKNQNPRLKTSLFSRSNLTLPPVKWRTMFRLILIVYNKKFILYDNVIYNSFKNLFCLLKKRIHNNADA